MIEMGNDIKELYGPSSEKNQIIEIFSKVYTEISMSKKKHGEQLDLTLPDWISILSEEVGEAAREANKFHFKEDDNPEHLTALRDELIQVACVAIKAIEVIETKNFKR